MKLFIPGPVTVQPDVLEKMTTQMIGHRSNDASVLQERISDNMRRLWNTSEMILLSTSSGSGLMEAAVRSCTAKKAAIFSVGAFGKRWYDMAVRNNVPADLYASEWGEITTAEEVDKVLKTGKYDLVTITHNETSTGVTNPLAEIAEVIKKYPDVIFCADTVSSSAGVKFDVDVLGIDIIITSSQKCLGLPPGIAICNFSQKAVERAKKVENRGFYLDLLSLYNYILKKNYQYPSTPVLPLMFGLDYKLEQILNVEGAENRYERHKKMAERVRDWAQNNFELFAKEGYASDTVTAITNTRGIDVKALNKELGKHGMQISNGYGDLKDKTFRIAHMADTQMEDIEELLRNIDDILNL